MSEDKKPKKITVEEVKAIEPRADCYEFNIHSRYIVVIKKSLLAGGDQLTKQRAQVVYEAFQTAKIPALILIGADEYLSIFEIKQ